MVKCVLTGKEEHPFKGIHLIKNDGSVEFYSSGKAMKNALKLKRDKRKLKWTEAYRINRAKVEQEHKRAEEEKKADVQKTTVEKAKKVKKGISL